MFEWLFGKKKSKPAAPRPSFPVYDDLKRLPNRGLPQEIREREGGPLYQERKRVLEAKFRGWVTDQPDDQPMFVVPVTGREVIMLRNPDGKGQSLLIFSSDLQCLDYAMTSMANLPMVQLLPQSLNQVVNLLRNVEAAGIRHFVFDRCPRCDHALVIETESIRTPEAFREIFIVHNVTKLVRQELYFEFAIHTAQHGNLQVALDVALETVGHVTLEHPNIHFLIGQLAIALKKPSMVEEARSYLRLLRAENYLGQLNRSEATATPDFRVSIW